MHRHGLWTCVLALAALLLPGAARADETIVLASTTSVEDSGLLGDLLPRFTAASGVTVRVVAQGTGQALDTARRGDADIVLVHDPEAEGSFMDQGFGVTRRQIAWNDFIIVGPQGDPALRQDQAGRVKPGPPVPAQLPPDVRGFTGRRAELDALDELATASGTAADGAGGRPLPIGIIAGVAGVGKTGLAVHWSHRARRRFPDGQLYADLRGYDAHQEPLPPAAVLMSGVTVNGVPDCAAKVRLLDQPPARRSAALE